MPPMQQRTVGTHALVNIRNVLRKHLQITSGVKYAVSLPSCTSGLHLALAALGIRPGDEVIVPDLTWIASAAPISYVGATPVFADIDENTWCLCAESVRACITENTKAILPVDLYGGVPEYPALRAIADEHHLKIIEDAAGGDWERIWWAQSGRAR